MLKAKLQEANLLRRQKGNREIYAGILAGLIFAFVLPLLLFLPGESGAFWPIFILVFPAFMGALFYVPGFPI